MATIYKRNRETEYPGLTGGAPVGGAAAGSGGAAMPQAHGAGQSGTGFVNIKSYLDANPEAAASMAKSTLDPAMQEVEGGLDAARQWRDDWRNYYGAQDKYGAANADWTKASDFWQQMYGLTDKQGSAEQLRDWLNSGNPMPTSGGMFPDNSKVNAVNEAMSKSGYFGNGGGDKWYAAYKAGAPTAPTQPNAGTPEAAMKAWNDLAGIGTSAGNSAYFTNQQQKTNPTYSPGQATLDGYLFGAAAGPQIASLQGKVSQLGEMRDPPKNAKDIGLGEGPTMPKPSYGPVSPTAGGGATLPAPSYGVAKPKFRSISSYLR